MLNEHQTGSGSSGSPLLKLEPRQQMVYAALADNAPECAKMYLAALRVWSDPENPERLCLAGHSLRELMNNIGPQMQVPLPDPELMAGQGTLNERFSQIEKLLKQGEKASGNWASGKWSGEIHTATASLLLEVQSCAEWRDLNIRLRKTKASNLLCRFDPLHAALPEEIQSLRIKEWQTTQSYFTRVAHHDRTSSEDFGRRVVHLESMLLQGLAPVAKQHLSEIDAIIKAGESR